MEVINFDVYHDGKMWVAENDELRVVAKTLDKLDENIKSKLRKTKKGKVKVTMELNYRKNLPHWMWQYHPYYFYRTIFLDLDQ